MISEVPGQARRVLVQGRVGAFGQQHFGKECGEFRLEQDAGHNSIQSTLVFMSPMTEVERSVAALKRSEEAAKEDKKKAKRRQKWLELNKEFSTANGD